MNLVTTFKDILQATKHNTALIESHIGSRADAHAVATFEQNGFMSFDDKNEVNMRGRHAMSVADGYDVLTPLAGLYIGRNFKNAPAPVDDSTCIVQITGNTSFKEIEFNWINGNRRFYRVIYNGTDSKWLNENNWQKVSPLNGASGYITVNRLYTGAFFVLGLRIDLDISFSTSAPVQICKLPTGYTTLDPNADYFNILGTDSTGNNVPLGLVITGGNTVSVFRADSSANAIAKARGYITVICENSNVS
ncbi:MAG: hypothetical protein ABF624_00170 [Liquorilactobacillus ghanensis]|uniref:hypothetical protein n=1 Tax=Liquorilactobacillus ghanensis TaxID=399370 RepID=UPI0039EC4B3A